MSEKISLHKQLKLPIVGETPLEWVQVVQKDFDAFLCDHAACERKATSLCMSFIVKYPDRPELADPMISLAKEELEHFQQVYRILIKRKITPGADAKDPYVNEIMAAMRHGRDQRLLDRLVVSGLIEARGCERFALLSENLTDPEMREFYLQLAKSEAGHYRVFIRLAELFFGQAEVASAVEHFVEVESKAMMNAELRPALH